MRYRMGMRPELPAQLSDQLGSQARSLMELEGLGRDVWQGVTVDVPGTFLMGWRTALNSKSKF